ncbi:hypothetical protein [Anaerosporobacter sp.]|uniref:hypothetical protein n=1 Tax=Anaerosporobacter sp. TaxID=1872529 RepID=UPI00286F7BAB|nr:hypothetical protein [Anaerosporobacter sp.]
MDEKEKNFYASAKPTVELFALFQRAEELDVDGLGKAEIYERAQRYLIKNKESVNFKSLSKKQEWKYDGDIPSSFKVRINDMGIDMKVTDIIKDEYAINRVMTPFKMKITLLAYIEHLEATGIFEDEWNKEETKSIDELRVQGISLVLRANREQLEMIINKLMEG